MLDILVAAANLAAIMSGSWKGGASRRLLTSKLRSLGLSAGAAELMVAPAADLTAERFARISRAASNAASWAAIVRDYRGWATPDSDDMFDLLREIELAGGLNWPPTSNSTVEASTEAN